MLTLVWIAKRTKKYVDRRHAGLPFREEVSGREAV